MPETLGNNNNNNNNNSQQKKRQINKKNKKTKEKKKHIGRDGNIINSNKNKTKRSPLWKKKKKKQDPSMTMIQKTTTQQQQQQQENSDSANPPATFPSSMKDQFWKTSTEELLQSNLLRSTCTVEYFTRVKQNVFLFSVVDKTRQNPGLKFYFKTGGNKTFFFKLMHFFSFYPIFTLIPYFCRTCVVLSENHKFEVGQLHQTSLKSLKT